MKRFALTLAVAGTVAAATNSAIAEPVSVLNDDGTVWVMQIEPQGEKVAPVAQKDGPLPIVQPAAVDLPKPAAVKAAAQATVEETVENAAEVNDVLAGDVPASRPPAVPVATQAVETQEVTAAKPVVEATDTAAPAAPVPGPASVLVEGEIHEHGHHDHDHHGHGMVIIPRGDTADCDLNNRYRQIYNSIPFNRAEYVANPAYRHDATMELLTGTPRPSAGYTGKTVRNREYTGYRPYLPSKSDLYRLQYPVRYGAYGYGRLPYYGYSYGQFPYIGY